MVPKPRLRQSSLSILIFLVSISLAVFLMGCANPRAESGVEAPSHLRKIGDDPLTIQWVDNAQGEEEYIISVARDGSWVEHARVGQSEVIYSFDNKICEVAEYYGSDTELKVQVSVNDPMHDQMLVTSAKIWDRRNTPEDRDIPLDPPIIKETVDYNPCRIWWDHSGAGFYPCSVEGEEGFRIYIGIFPEDERVSGNSAGWTEIATVGKHIRSYGFNQMCSDVLLVGYGEKLWAFVEAFSTRNLLGDGDAFSEVVLLQHSERPTLPTVEAAGFHEVISPQSRIGEQVVGTDPYNPENISFDGEYETENIYQSYTSEIIIQGDHPYLAVTGKTNNSHGQTSASIVYFFQVVPRTFNAPMDIVVPLIVEVQGRASTAIWPRYSKATARISLEVTGIEYYSTLVGACNDTSVPSLCTNPSSIELDEKYPITLDFVHNNIGSVTMTAGLDIYESGSGKVVIEEPKIYIDPTFEARELYKIVYSEGISSFDEQ